jgi:DNA topoisomerase-3
VCEKAVGVDRSCDFRSGKLILQQPVEPAQMQKLLATGRTDLLTGFISKKGRKFKAYLAKGPERVVFEFEPRKTPQNKVEEPAAPAPVAPRKGKGRAAAAAEPAGKTKGKKGSAPPPQSAATGKRPATKPRRKSV